MKKLIMAVMVLTSLTSYAELITQKDCARRYIEGSKDLVAIAQDYNNALIDELQYSAQVTAVDSAILGLRAICGFKENRQAQECVDETKPVYQDIRAKMYVREVLKGNLNKVEVSGLDLALLTKGAVKGFIKKITRGEENNICRLND